MIPAPLVEAAMAAVAPQASGRVRRSVGLRIEVEGIDAAIGDVVAVDVDGEDLMAEVAALDHDALACLPLGRAEGLRRGQRARRVAGGIDVPVGPGLLGRVLD
ncbi:MAG: EscN/YscN/HrcN family type III secretion system ATPase, partial [Acidimicrobiales bacterium]